VVNVAADRTATWVARKYRSIGIRDRTMAERHAERLTMQRARTTRLGRPVMTTYVLRAVPILGELPTITSEQHSW
jgi:hypothetical protein